MVLRTTNPDELLVASGAAVPKRNPGSLRDELSPFLRALRVSA
jgi:hypothetical protein